MPVYAIARPVQYFGEFSIRQTREFNSSVHIPAQSRYFIWANKFRTHFDQVIGSSAMIETNPLLWFADEAGLFLSYWYAALYVVIEGWRETGFRDSEIDALLSSPNVEYLRKYRNGVCHFQPKYLDSRFLEMASSSDSVQWVRTLNRAFGRFFLEAAKRSTTNIDG